MENITTKLLHKVCKENNSNLLKENNDKDEQSNDSLGNIIFLSISQIVSCSCKENLKKGLTSNLNYDKLKDKPIGFFVEDNLVSFFFTFKDSCDKQTKKIIYMILDMNTYSIVDYFIKDTNASGKQAILEKAKSYISYEHIPDACAELRHDYGYYIFEMRYNGIYILNTDILLFSFNRSRRNYPLNADDCKNFIEALINDPKVHLEDSKNNKSKRNDLIFVSKEDMERKIEEFGYELKSSLKLLNTYNCISQESDGHYTFKLYNKTKCFYGIKKSYIASEDIEIPACLMEMM